MPNYEAMTKAEIWEFCSDDPQRWADFFFHTMPHNADRHELADFFREMLDHAADVRRARYGERGPG